MNNSSENFDKLKSLIYDNLNSWDSFEDAFHDAAVDINNQFILIDRNELPKSKLEANILFVGSQAFPLTESSAHLYQWALDYLVGASFFKNREEQAEEERKKVSARRLELYRSVVDSTATEVPPKLHALLDEVYEARKVKTEA